MRWQYTGPHRQEENPPWQDRVNSRYLQDRDNSCYVGSQDSQSDPHWRYEMNDLHKRMLLAQQAAAQQKKDDTLPYVSEKKPISVLAIISFLLSLLIFPFLFCCMKMFGWFSLWATILPWIWIVAAVSMGPVAWIRIRKSRGAIGGNALAVAGILLGWIQFVFLLPGLVEDLVRLGGF